MKYIIAILLCLRLAQAVSNGPVDLENRVVMYPHGVEIMLDSRDIITFYDSPTGFEASRLLPYTKDSIENAPLWFIIVGSSPLRFKVKAYDFNDGNFKYLFEGWVNKENTYVFLAPRLYGIGDVPLLEVFTDPELTTSYMLPGFVWYDEATPIDFVWPYQGERPAAKVMFNFKEKLITGYVVEYTGNPYGPLN